MSNLSSLMQNGSVQVAESIEYEPMTESQMVQLMQVALEDVAINDLPEVIATEGTDLMEGMLPEDSVIMEKTIVKLDKKAQKEKAYKLAILQCAKDANDKDYQKLQTIWSMQNLLMRRLEKKYASRARSRMKQTAKKTNNTKIGSKLKSHLSKPRMTRAERQTQRALAGDTKIPSKVKSQFNSISNQIGNKIK